MQIVYELEENFAQNPLAQMVFLLAPGSQAVGHVKPWERNKHLLPERPFHRARLI